MFKNISFNGTFRSYQQKILDRADKYLADGRINVVAAPGSGKTILGLELIRRLGKPCLVLSPTTTIRDQWGQRFIQGFLSCDGKDLSSMVSFDLHFPAAITSVTYQALYSAVERVGCNDDEVVDCSDLDIYKVIKEAGVETLCLDEAHHLQNEWQRALEKFVASLDGKVKIISLTATPPYDANAGEWKRYTDVCGEIDEEIFVPELVKQGTLCPHQDYIYFSFPNKGEAADFKNYEQRVQEAMDELRTHPVLKTLCANLNYRDADLNGLLDVNFKELCAVVALLRHYGLEVDKQLLRAISVKKEARIDTALKELALNFIASDERLLDEKEREEFKAVFKKRDLVERGKITLGLNDKLKRKLVSSVGKLDSIAEIAKFESKNLKENLRLLVLTDYIRKETISSVGSDKKFDSVSLISVFETLRRIDRFSVGALSGSLVILPVKCAESLTYSGVKFRFKALEGTEYAEFFFKGGNREKVEIVGSLFEKGEVRAIVGTKSLLGEGWDSPCINTLILASFVGSFMLSNQMRGRAIRTDRNNPFKTADIWHLVTVEPNSDAADGGMPFYDFEMLTRRFESFVAPSYSFDRIESGIGRVTVIEPPYTEKGIEKINDRMRELACDRQALADKWNSALAISSEMFQMSEVPKDRKFPAFTFYNLARLGLLSSIVGLVVWLICEAFYKYTSAAVHWFVAVAGIVIIFVAANFIWSIISTKLLKHSNPKKSIITLADCVLQTLKECGKITSDCAVEVRANKIGTQVHIRLKGAAVREQKLFTVALCDMFSPIENPRYIIIPRGILGYRYRYALACPNVLGSKQEYAELFAAKLKKSTGRLEVVYTRNEKGRAFIRKCRRNAYISENARQVEQLFGNF